MKRLSLSILLVLTAFLVISPAAASLWNTKTNAIAIRANHAGYIDDETIEHFTQNVLPELILLLEQQGYTVANFSLLSSQTLADLFNSLPDELKTVIFGPDASNHERALAILEAFGVDAATGLFGFSITLGGSGERAGTEVVATLQTPNFTSDLLEYATPDNLALFKIRHDGSSLPFTAYADSADEALDGHWCLLDVNGAIVPHEQSLDSQGVYSIRYWIKNNGAYDLNADDLVIDDPVVLGFKNSDDSSGCVLRPRAGFGLDWLLLLAPLAFLVRRRA